VIHCGPGLDAVPSMDRCEPGPIEQRIPGRGCSCDPRGRDSMQFPRWIECEPGPIEQRTPGRGCSCDPLRAGFHAPTPIPRRVGFAITPHTKQKRYWFCNRGTSSNARRDALQLTYPGFQGFVCAKKPIDSSASRRTPPPPQGEPYNVRRMSATLRTQCGLETAKTAS